MKNLVIAILCVLLLISIVDLYITRDKLKKEIHTEQIDSLDSKIDSIFIIKDSIQKDIDTVFIKIKDNNNQYEEDRNNILNNNAIEDYRFFRDYINANKARLDSCVRPKVR